MFPVGIMEPIEIRTAEDLGKAIRAARREQGLRQEELALGAGTGRRFISDLERGKPTAQIGPALKVVAALGLRIQLHSAKPGPQGQSPWTS